MEIQLVGIFMGTRRAKLNPGEKDREKIERERENERATEIWVDGGAHDPG